MVCTLEPIYLAFDLAAAMPTTWNGLASRVYPTPTPEFRACCCTFQGAKIAALKC